MSNEVEIYIPCCDASLPIVEINSFLFNKFWSDAKVNYLGFKKPNFELHNPNHKFISVADKQEGGANNWTRYIHQHLKTLDVKHIIFSIDDYWICQKPNLDLIHKALETSVANNKVGRFDLTFDSQVEGNIFPVEAFKPHRIAVKHPQAPYRVSTQPAIWKLDYLLELLDNNWSPWQFELSGTEVVKNKYKNTNLTFCYYDEHMVDYPLRTIAKGAVSRHNPNKFNVLGFSTDTIKELVEHGYFTEDELIWGQWEGKVPTFEEKGGYNFDPGKMEFHPTSKTFWKEYHSVYNTKPLINLFDECFSHTEKLWGYISSNGTDAWGEPKNVRFCSKMQNFNGITLFTDHYLGNRDFIESINTRQKIAWLCESPAVHPWAHEYILKTYDLFDLIITYDKKLSEKLPNAVYANIMETRVLPKNCKIHKKDKLVSLIAADKRSTEGHKYRFEIVEKFADKYKIDLWGSAFKSFNLKAEPLKDYCFSITVHNCRVNDFYTDALIDCFSMGTVPIFWGCPNIGEYFDEKGILSFETNEELEQILSDLSYEKYNKLMPHIKNNFEISKKFRTTKDDQIYNIIKERIKNEN